MRTPEEQAASLELTAKAIRSRADGKPWQWKGNGYDWMNGTSTDEITAFGVYEYRPTPERKLRPWTRDEVPLGCHVVHGNGTKTTIATVWSEHVYLLGIGTLQFDTLNRDWKQLETGEPCGVYEEAP